MTTKFPLGQVVATSNCLHQIQPAVLTLCLMRHAAGDWGDLDDEDKATNEAALSEEEPQRLMSSYQIDAEIKVWVITEWDRSVTTLLLPEDY